MLPLGNFWLFVITSQTNVLEVHFINKHIKSPNCVSSYFVLPMEKWSARAISSQAFICFSYLTGETCICPVHICSHRETLGDSHHSTVDDREGHRTNLPRSTILSRCYEQEEEGQCITKELLLQRLDWKYWSTSFCKKYIQKERRGWEEVKDETWWRVGMAKADRIDYRKEIECRR